MGNMNEAMQGQKSKEEQAKLKKLFGMPCPACAENMHTAAPKILMPYETCWCGYLDTRERILPYE